MVLSSPTGSHKSPTCADTLRYEMCPDIRSYGSAIPTMPPPTLCFASSVHTVECKWVTVLCCTLVGATVMDESHAPAGQHHLLHAFLDLAIPEVRRYGGTLQHVMPR